MENVKVKIISNFDGKVVIDEPDYRVKREWENKGVVRVIEFDQLQELVYNVGVENLFKEGYLVIEDLEIKKALGLEPEDATEPVNIIILNDDQKKNLLLNKPLAEFKKSVEKMGYAQAVELAKFAVSNEITPSYDKCEYLQKVTQINIRRAVEMNAAAKN